jgi:V/A-type H+-transporting ATPase subunit I
MLDQHDVSRMRLPPGFDRESPDAAIASLASRLSAIPDELAGIEQELKQIGQKWGGTLHASAVLLQDELETYQVFPLLGQTELTFVLVGWVPAKQLDALESALQEAAEGRLAIDELPVTEEDKKQAPVALDNPRVARPFEGLVHLFSTPPYAGLDPTPLMAFFMPLFFGMMLGDIGYGVLLLGLTWWLRRRFQPGMLRDLATILALGSLWSIVFGVLYGELFGTLGEQVGLHPVLFDRMGSEHLLDLLALTLGVGGVHLLLSMLLGVWEGIRKRNRHDLLERGGRLLGLIALFGFAGILLDVLPRGFMTPTIALLIVGTVLLAWSVGKIGLLLAPIEMIGLVGNVLSYLRIAAIGLSSVYLALVAGEMVGVLGSVVVGGIVAVLLHALNMALGAFSPTIQSLRLHYVEFFRNFYVGGGRRYAPFQLRFQRQGEQ